MFGFSSRNQEWTCCAPARSQATEKQVVTSDQEAKRHLDNPCRIRNRLQHLLEVLVSSHRLCLMDRVGRYRFFARKLAGLHVALALFVQFAPTIHAVTPHDSPTSFSTCKQSSCNHDRGKIHFEAARAHNNDSPCAVCAQLLDRQIFLATVGIRVDEVLTGHADSSAPEVHRGSSILRLPDSRGPPPIL